MLHNLSGRISRFHALQGIAFMFMAFGAAAVDAADTPRDEQGIGLPSTSSDQTPSSDTATSISTSQGKWKVHRNVSLIDDQEIVAVWLYAEEPIKGWLNTTHQPMLIIRYMEGKLNCYINTGCAPDIEWSEPGASVTFRFDKEEAESTRCGVSTDNDALIFPHTEEFIRRIADAQQLVVRFTPFHANPATMVFNVSGLRAAIEPLEKASGWSLDTKRDRLSRRLIERFLPLDGVDVNQLSVTYENRRPSQEAMENDLRSMLENMKAELDADPSLSLRITVHGVAATTTTPKRTSKEMAKILFAALKKWPLPKGSVEITLGDENQPLPDGSNTTASDQLHAEAHETIDFEFLIHE